MNEDLGPILQTIREVNVSLERRYQRALGASMMIWGLVGATIFGFYQLVAWNTDRYRALFGPLLSWVWVVPIALGYVASSVVGARLGRMGADADARRRFRSGLIPGAIASVVVTLLLIAGRGAFIPSAVIFTVGASTTIFSWLAPPRRSRAWGLGIGIALVAASIALLLLDPLISNGAAALCFAIGFGLLGTVIYRSGA